MDKLEIYHHLPYPMKVLGASLHGYYLRWWRYGKDTEKLVEEALERDTWTESQWKSWQEERLAYILHRAATKVPYYRDQWQKRRASGDKASWDYLENWPILSKEDLRQKPRAFLADDCNPRFMFEEHTSGTTGTPVTQWLSRKTVHQWYAIYEARMRIWHGVNRNSRWGIIGGQLVTPISQQEPPFWVWNRGLRQLYLSAYHISKKTIKDYLAAMSNYGLSYLLGYTSALYTIAKDGVSVGLNAPKLEIVLCNAEPVYDFQRQIIEAFFNCPVRETYGMTEIVVAASECEKGSLHLFPDVGILEVLSFVSDSRAEEKQAGRFVCTGLLNEDMPLIRYDTGDAGTINKTRHCECHREMQILQEIEGRTDDMIITTDGRRIGRMDPIFKIGLNIKEGQIIQEALDFIRVKIVPADGFNNRDVQDIIQRVHQRLGASVRVEVELVDEIPRTKAGKFKAVISNLKQEK